MTESVLIKIREANWKRLCRVTLTFVASPSLSSRFIWPTQMINIYFDGAPATGATVNIIWPTQTIDVDFDGAPSRFIWPAQIINIYVDFIGAPVNVKRNSPGWGLSTVADFDVPIICAVLESLATTTARPGRVDADCITPRRHLS